jgi:hypothetical protein
MQIGGIYRMRSEMLTGPGTSACCTDAGAVPQHSKGQDGGEAVQLPWGIGYGTGRPIVLIGRCSFCLFICSLTD